MDSNLLSNLIKSKTHLEVFDKEGMTNNYILTTGNIALLVIDTGSTIYEVKSDNVIFSLKSEFLHLVPATNLYFPLMTYTGDTFIAVLNTNGELIPLTNKVVNNKALYATVSYFY